MCRIKVFFLFFHLVFLSIGARTNRIRSRKGKDCTALPPLEVWFLKAKKYKTRVLVAFSSFHERFEVKQPTNTNHHREEALESKRLTLSFSKRREVSRDDVGTIITTKSDRLFRERRRNDSDRISSLGTGERDGFTVLDGITFRVSVSRIQPENARSYLSLQIKTKYFHRRERYKGVIRSRDDCKKIREVLESTNDFSHEIVGVSVGDDSGYSRRVSGGRRHVVLVLRLSRTNDAQNELVWSERGDVGDTGAEILGVAVLRGDFEQSVGGEVVVARRFGETERGVEIRVDRRGMRGRDVGEKSDGNRGEDETVTARRVREDEN